MAQPLSNPRIEELRFKLKTDPKSRLFYPLAEELRKVGGYAEAEGVLRLGLETHPAYLSAWVSLGRVLRDLKKDADAVPALSKALTLDPGNVVAARILADAYLALGEKVEAIKKYKLVHALMPSDEELVAVIARLDAEINQPASLPVAAEEAPEPAWEPEAAQPEPIPFTPPAEPEAPPPPPLAFTPAEQEADSPFGSAFDDERSGSAPEPIPFPVQSPPDPLPFATLTPQAAPEPPALEAPTLEAPTIEEPPFSPESRFDETSPWGARSMRHEEAERAIETGDVEPMRAAHAESPFEEPAVEAGYGSSAFEVEAPQGMHIEEAPLAAELPAPVVDAPSEEADVFAPAATAEPFALESPPAESEPEDSTSTLTMADLYARQGLVADARHIYEHLLARDPGNAVVREKLLALDPPFVPEPEPEAEPVHVPAAMAMATVTPAPRGKVARLEQWLAKVGKREDDRV
jgi:tetratricopeptide (TPR) repeat protein